MTLADNTALLLAVAGIGGLGVGMGLVIGAWVVRLLRAYVADPGSRNGSGS